MEKIQSSAVASPLVSVIVLNWNGRRCLDDCLSALAAQTCRDFAVVLVDNASMDDSVAFVRERFPWVRLVLLEENRGFAGGNAAGLAATWGTDVVLLNNDTAPDPGWLAALVAAAAADPRRGAVASLVVDWTGQNIDSAGDGLRVTGLGYQRYHGAQRSEAPDSGPVFGACGCAVLYRRALLDEVGFLDERFFMNGEDTDLGFRARLAGWEVWFCAEAVVRHRVSASQVAGSAQSIFLHERNRYWSLFKCMPASLLLEYAWVFALEFPARAWHFGRQGRAGAWLRGVLAGLAGWNTMRPQRRAIQAGRRISIQHLDALLALPRQLGGPADGPR